jgi:hypothetical protein
MSTMLRPEVRTILDLCATTERRRGACDPDRAIAAYERRLAAAGLEHRVCWVADPADLLDWEIALGRSVKAARFWAATMARPDRGPSVLRDVRTVPIVRATPPAWEPWETWRESWAAVDPTGAFAMARQAWEVAAGWPARSLRTAAADGSGVGVRPAAVAWREVPAWDVGVNWAGAIAELAAASPMLAWASARHGTSAQAPGWAALALAFGAAPVIGAAAAAAASWDSTAAWDAGLAVGCLNLPERNPDIDRLIAVYEPMIAACTYGAFAHSLLEREVVVLALPTIRTERGRLHCADGPALAWHQTKVYAWKGIVVPERLILRRQEITADAILAEPNQEMRRVMIELYGTGRYVHDMGARLVHADATGRLWRLQPEPPSQATRAASHRQPDDLAAVEVTNGTVEPDGTRKTYWLAVPPEIATAKAAVAWTYGMTPGQYDRLVVRT